MKKLIAVVMVLTFAMSFLAAPAFAAMPKAGKGVVDAGNKMCPVSGDPVSGKNFVTYKGVRYGLCCPMCRKSFLKDPEKYLAQMKAKERVPAAPKGTVVPIDPKSKKMEKAMEQGSL